MLDLRACPVTRARDLFRVPVVIQKPEPIQVDVAHLLQAKLLPVVNARLIRAIFNAETVHYGNRSLS